MPSFQAKMTCHLVVELDNNLKLSARFSVMFRVCIFVCMCRHFRTKTTQSLSPPFFALTEKYGLSGFIFSVAALVAVMRHEGWGILYPYRGTLMKYSLLGNYLFYQDPWIEMLTL